MTLSSGGAAGSAVPAPSAAQPAALAAADAPLAPDEVVILRLKPHPVFILLSSLGVAIGAAVIASPLYLLAANGWAPVGPRWVSLGAAAVVVARLAWAVLDWWARDYVLTDRRVIRVFGVIRRDRFETPLRNVQHTALTQSVLERLFALGTLGFATSGTAVIEAAWVNVERPGETLRVVREAVERYGRA